MIHQSERCLNNYFWCGRFKFQAARDVVEKRFGNLAEKVLLSQSDFALPAVFPVTLAKGAIMCLRSPADPSARRVAASLSEGRGSNSRSLFFHFWLLLKCQRLSRWYLVGLGSSLKAVVPLWEPVASGGTATG